MYRRARRNSSKNPLKIGRSGSSRSLVFGSDMHVMSNFAIAPPSVSDELLEFPNIQHKFYEAWEWCLDQRKQRTDVFWLNGEPVDGTGRIMGGRELWTTKLQTGIDASYELLKMYKPTVFAATLGSDYHTNADGLNIEEQILAKFGDKSVEINPYEKLEDSIELEKSRRVYNFAFFKLFNVVFSLTHHIRGGLSFMYKPTALGREMFELTLSADKWLKQWQQYEKLIVVRSHTHDFVEVRFGSQLGFKTPAWKLPDWFLLKKGLGNMPHIGTVEVVIEPNSEVNVYPHIVHAKDYPKVNIFDLEQAIIKREKYERNQIRKRRSSRS